MPEFLDLINFSYLLLNSSTITHLDIATTIIVPLHNGNFKCPTLTTSFLGISFVESNKLLTLCEFLHVSLPLFTIYLPFHVQIELTSHCDHLSRLHTLNSFSQGMRIIQKKIHLLLSPTFSLLSICFQAGEHGWGKCITTLSGLQWEFNPLKSVHISLVVIHPLPKQLL